MVFDDKKNMNLEDIVPEYKSRFFLAKKMHWDRIKRSIEFVDIKDNTKLLDLGCGIGYLLREIRKKNDKCKCYGIDSNVNVKRLRIPDCDTQVADARKLPFKDDYFDIVFALDTLEHIKDTEKAVIQVKRVLKDSGSLILTGPTESLLHKFCRFLIKGTFSGKRGPGPGAHYYNTTELQKILEKHGFKILKDRFLPRFLPIDRVIKFKNVK